MKVPNGLGTVSDLQKRFDKANELWELWRSLHQEAFEFAAPNRETFRHHSPGQKKDRQIFDSTAVLGLQQFSNRIQGAMFPPWVEWQDFVAGDQIPEEEKVRTDKGLEEVKDAFFSSLNHSNFYTELSPALVDLGIGTGAIMVEEAPFGSDQVLQFSNVPLAELRIERPPSGPIESTWRKQSIRPVHIKRIWPEAVLPNELQKLADKEDSKEVDICNGMLFNPDDQKYHQVVLWNKELIFTQPFDTKRLIVFRYHVTPGEVFGRGPIIQQLPDIRTVNVVKEFILKNAAIQMSGMYTAVADGAFNPHTVTLGPGTIIPVSSNMNTNPSLRPLDRSGDLQMGAFVLEDLQNNIRKALFADPMGDLTDPVRTATEIMLRNQEMLRTAGASFGRLKTELVEPLTNAVMDILGSLGLVPKIKVDGDQVTIKQNSPLAKAEQLEDFQNAQTWVGSLMQLEQIQPGITSGAVKIEELPKQWAEQLGVSPNLVRSEDEPTEGDLGQAVETAALAQIAGGAIEPAA